MLFESEFGNAYVSFGYSSLYWKLIHPWKPPEGSAAEEENFKRAYRHAANSSAMAKFLLKDSVAPVKIGIF